MFNYTHKYIMKTFNGIMMVALTAMFYLFCGCSQDEDDYNNSDMYTLAEEMGTRGGGGDNTAPILDGEYDTSTLTISISNFSGSADIYIYTVQGHNMMDVTTTNVVNGTLIDFSLSDYTTGVDYEIYISLSNGEAYVGQFVL